MPSAIQRKVRINLQSLEEDDRPVYLTGDFNNWNPLDVAYEMSKTDAGYSFELEIGKPDPVAFKFTRGGWENVEIDRYGNITGNRVIAPTDTQRDEVVERWRVNWSPFKKEFFPLTKLVSDNFKIPQLKKTRRVWALLPYDYHQSKKRYPVIYLQDAQNLFNEGSEFGNWEIDKKLSILAEYGRGDIIVVAVEHGHEERTREYLLGKNKILKGAQGKKMIRFMADTLKPYIDRKYRTKPDREYTGIGGSSLGGLISIYAGFLYPEVYSKLMIFSPSLWAAPDLHFSMLPLLESFESRMYMYAGDNESRFLLKHVNNFVKQLKSDLSKTDSSIVINKRIRPGGTHSEFYWAQEFPRALEWLFFNSKDDPLTVRSENKQLSYD